MFYGSIFSVKLEANSSADREGFQSFRKNGDFSSVGDGRADWRNRSGQEESWRVHVRCVKLWDLLKQCLATWCKCKIELAELEVCQVSKWRDSKQGS